MTNEELRKAKRQLEDELTLAYRSAVSKFEGQTGLRVTSVDFGTTRIETVGGESLTVVADVRVHVEV